MSNKNGSGLFGTIIWFAIVFAVLAAFYYYGEKESGPGASAASVSFLEGQVDVLNDSLGWKQASDGIVLNEGDSIRTGLGKAVLSFEDGSALRLDALTEVEVVRLSGKSAVFSNKQGRVYLRVKDGTSAQYQILAQEASVSAQGTAFTVACDQTKKTVAVLMVEGSAKVRVERNSDAVESKIESGSKLDLDLSKPITEAVKTSAVDLEIVKSDSFYSWNKEEDIKIGDPLGVLEAVEDAEGIEDAEGEDGSEDVENAEGADVAEDANNEEAKEDQVLDLSQSAPAESNSGIFLKASAQDDGVRFTWVLNQTEAPYGFKISRGTEPNPYYPKNDFVYISSVEAREYTWKITDGKTYHFRICTWNGGKTSESACVVHSNDVQVTTKQASINISGFEYVASELVLGATTSESGVNLSWNKITAPGFQGYKVVRSETDANLYYPKNGYIKWLPDDINATGYTDDSAERGKSYYYRICSLESEAPTYCGNVVQVQY
ncbi:MAG: hypothetical protein ACD_76C00118G0004 [uncultured bacterium]|nr:MAG: hypothetical protein ACD_76C00118G0004 [uncultured bacterium]HBD04973.1 hypothetical protein [Candidatus Uhrbacteria bacterium]